MASNKLQAARRAAADDMKMDMSSMIDMVFLLLIFFMIASNMITIKRDPEVLPPVADGSIVPDNYNGRFIVNIYKNGDLHDINGEPITEDEIKNRIEKVSTEEQAKGRKAKLYVRADRESPVLSVKKVAKAAGAVGVNNVIFSSFKTTAGDPVRASESKK